MTVLSTNALRAQGFAFAPRLTRLVENMAAAWEKGRKRRITRRALSRLDDRVLADIGLNRADIDRLF